MADELIERIVADLADHFSEFDDSNEAPFGELPRVSAVNGVVQVLHETEDWGVSLVVAPVWCDCSASTPHREGWPKEPHFPGCLLAPVQHHIGASEQGSDSGTQGQ